MIVIRQPLLCFGPDCAQFQDVFGREIRDFDRAIAVFFRIHIQKKVVRVAQRQIDDTLEFAQAILFQKRIYFFPVEVPRHQICWDLRQLAGKTETLLHRIPQPTPFFCAKLGAGDPECLEEHGQIGLRGEVCGVLEDFGQVFVIPGEAAGVGMNAQFFSFLDERVHVVFHHGEKGRHSGNGCLLDFKQPASVQIEQGQGTGVG